MQLPEFAPNDLAVLWFLRDFCDDWSQREKSAYGMLYLRMGADLRVWPGKWRLAKDMGAGDKRTATAALDDLILRKAVSVEQEVRFDPVTGAQQSKVYKLTPPWLVANSWDGKAWPYPLDRTTKGEGAKNVPPGTRNAPGEGNSCNPLPVSKNEPKAINASKKNNEAEHAWLPPDFLQTLERQIGETLSDQDKRVLIKHERRRLEYAGARVEEEREAGTAERPKGLFFYLLKHADDKEIAEQEEGDGPASEREEEDSREAIRRSRSEAQAGSRSEPDAEEVAATAEHQRIREHEQQMLFGPKTEQPDTPQQPKEPTEEEKLLKEINRARNVAVGRQMSRVYAVLAQDGQNPSTSEVYEALMPFFDSVEYLELGAAAGDAPDPVRDDYARRLEQARKGRKAS